MGLFDMFRKKQDIPPPPLDEPASDKSMPPPGDLPQDGMGPMPMDTPGDQATVPPPEHPPLFAEEDRVQDDFKPKFDRPVQPAMDKTGMDTGIDIKDVQLILSRLDTIRAELENIKERLGRLEPKQYKW